MKISLILLTVAMAAVLSGCQTTVPVNTPVDDETSVNEETVEAETAFEDLYITFTQEAYDSMLGEKPFALFFHAPWCPTCQFMEQDILSKLNGFPEGAVILKADYDTETALKEQYNITSQSLVVMINADGTVAETLVAPSATSLQDSFSDLLE